MAKKTPPESPQSAKDQHGDDDGHRMEVDRLREEHRHQQVAIEGLNDQIRHHQPGELRGEAPLEQGDHGHWHRHHGGAYVGDQHREADCDRQQHRIAQSHQGEGDIGGDTNDQDLDHLAADVVDDLVVHLDPHPVDQGAVARQEAAQAAHQYPLVLEHEEDHQRHQNEVDHDGHHVHQRAERGAHQMLAATENALADVVDNGLHQTDVDKLGITVRQGADIILSVGQHGRRLFGQIDPLTDQGRDKP